MRGRFLAQKLGAGGSFLHCLMVNPPLICTVLFAVVATNAGTCTVIEVGDRHLYMRVVRMLHQQQSISGHRLSWPEYRCAVRTRGGTCLLIERSNCRRRASDGGLVAEASLRHARWVCSRSRRMLNEVNLFSRHLGWPTSDIAPARRLVDLIGCGEQVALTPPSPRPRAFIQLPRNDDIDAASSASRSSARTAAAATAAVPWRADVTLIRWFYRALIGRQSNVADVTLQLINVITDMTDKQCFIVALTDDIDSWNKVICWEFTGGQKFEFLISQGSVAMRLRWVG